MPTPRLFPASLVSLLVHGLVLFHLPGVTYLQLRAGHYPKWGPEPSSPQARRGFGIALT